MAATVFGTARHGVVDDSAATDMHISNLDYSYSTEKAYAKNSEGFSVGMAFFEDKADITASGVVAVKSTGLTATLGSAMTLLNESADSLSLNDQNMLSTPSGSAGTVVTDANLSRTSTDFESGTLTLVYMPLVPLA